MLDKAFEDAIRLTDPPEVLYHYTTWSGVKGILTSQRFRATAHDCTNDEGELRSADRIIKDVAIGLRTKAKGTAIAVLDQFLDGYPGLQIGQLTAVYLSCFSAARDDKEQWSKYADGGCGVCLGISVINEQGPMISDRGIAWVRVDYSEDSWRADVTRQFKKVCSSIKGLKGTKENIGLGLFALCRFGAHASIRAKQDRWRGEKEYRRVILPLRGANVQPIEYESGGKVKRCLLVPVRAEGKRIALDEIIIGPKKNYEEGRRQLTQLLADAGYRDDEAEYPKIAPSIFGDT